MADREELNLAAAFEFARDLLKSLVFVNGGAVVALLAFYGGGDTGRQFGSDAFFGLMSFTLGVVAAVSSNLAAYFAQLNFGWRTPNPVRGQRTLRVAILLAILSLAMFVAGAVVTGAAMGNPN